MTEALLTEEVLQNPAVIEETEKLPFTDAQIAAWKSQHGEFNINLITGLEDYSHVVVRGIGRDEFKDLAGRDYRTQEELENVFVESALLYPSLTLTELRASNGGFIPKVFEKVMEHSNVDPEREFFAEELIENGDGMIPSEAELLKQADITDVDMAQWRASWSKVYYYVTEHKIFIYHGLRRSDFEKFKELQTKNNFQGPDSEEELLKQGMIYPYNMDAGSDKYLHGTITALAKLVYSASGFSSNAVSVTL